MNALNAIRRAVFPAAELVLGMGIAQFIATAQVYFSNRRLFAQMTAVAAAGFLPVPNPQVLPRLLDLETAFWGGLFFTLSIGSGLALVSAAAAGLWRRFPSGRRLTAIGLAAAIAVMAVLLNRRGFDPWATLYVIAVPPPVFWMATRWGTSSGTARDGPPLGLRLLPLALLALGWFTQYDANLFLDLRDHLLMSNAAGEKVSAFYYRYTLYPAEVFKTFDQRQIKTVAWPAGNTDGRQSAVGRELIRLDYLPVNAAAPADLVLRFDDGDRLTLARGARPVWEGAIGRFLSDPGRAASDISVRTDRFTVFRAAVYFGVLLAFPITLYVVLFALVRVVCGIAFTERRAEAAAAILCLLVGFAALADFHLSREGPPPSDATAAALESDRWQRRVAALKASQARRWDVCAGPGYAAKLGSPYPQERYWLARALAASPNPQASADLIRLMDDPQVNVRTMAVQALAQRRDPRAVQPILNLLKTSQEWYVQLYAYRALRTLQWDQTRLN